MATPTFSVNGGAAIPGVIAKWEALPKRNRLNGVVDLQPMYRHTWDIPQMTVSQFEALQALSGQVLTSLETTTYNDFNNGDTYINAEMGLITGSQVGRRMTNVRIEFRVKL